MSVLMIGATERERIKEMITWAKAHPISLDLIRNNSVKEETAHLVSLADRNENLKRPPSIQMMFPGNYRAALSCEEQPAGFFLHLSVSVEGRARRGMMPHPAAVQMIAEEFGIKFPPDQFWVEEFDPGEFAINLLSLYLPREEGNA